MAGEAESPSSVEEASNGEVISSPSGKAGRSTRRTSTSPSPVAPSPASSSGGKRRTSSAKASPGGVSSSSSASPTSASKRTKRETRSSPSVPAAEAKGQQKEEEEKKEASPAKGEEKVMMEIDDDDKDGEAKVANDDANSIDGLVITADMREANEEARRELEAALAKASKDPSAAPQIPFLLQAAGLSAEDAPSYEMLTAPSTAVEGGAANADATASSSSSFQTIPQGGGEGGGGGGMVGGGGNGGVRRTAQLETLLQKASHFNQFIVTKLEHGQAAALAQKDGNGSSKKKEKKKGGKKKGKREQAAEEAKNRAAAEAKSKQALQDATTKMVKGKEEGEGEELMQQPKSLTGGVLKPYQLEGLSWLASLYVNGFNGILADEMGLGKTIQVIALFALLRDRGVYGPFLVIAPLATLPNWILEVRKWLPGASTQLYHGPKRERQLQRGQRMPLSRERQKSKFFPIVVTSYEIAQLDRKHLERYEWKWIIVDEGQRIKNRNGKLFNELKEIPSESRLLLSGTPIQNSLEELWTLLNFCQPDIFDNLDIFRSWFGFHTIGKDTTVDDIIDEEHRERVVTKLHEILRPFLLRRLKKDVDIILPKKKEIVLYANMSEIQRDYYHLAEKSQLRDALVKQGVPDAQHIKQTNPQMLLRKVCNHPFMVGEPVDKKGRPIGVVNPTILIEASGKLKLMDRMLRRLHHQGHRVLIFSQMTEMMTVLEDYLRYRRWAYRRIDGSVGIDDRQVQIEEFNNNSDLFVFLLSTRAGGLGINLAGADTVIIYDSDWNPHRDAQAQDRCHRIGQTKDVAVYRLLTVGTVEIEMMEAQISKKKLERLSIVGGDFRKAGRRSRGEMTAESLRELLKDDVQNIQRMAHTAASSAATTSDQPSITEHDISEEELDTVLDRVKMFHKEQDGKESLAVEGGMYDVVQGLGGDILSGMNS